MRGFFLAGGLSDVLDTDTPGAPAGGWGEEVAAPAGEDGMNIDKINILLRLCLRLWVWCI